MEVIGRSPSRAGGVRKGSNPMFVTKRSKIQSERSLLNQQLNKQMRLRAGAENLYNATSNNKVKDTVALELSFFNSNLQLLKDELSLLNSHLTPYQNESAKTQSMAMISLGLKETKELDFTQPLKDFILEHYSEDPDNFDDEIADLIDLRNSIRTPARSNDGVSLLLEYFSQLYFIDYRFFPPNLQLRIHFHWYDSITGIPSTQKSMSLEKASILFNVAALYTQIGTRAERCKRAGIDEAIKAYEHAAGAFNYVRLNFSHAPCTDLSHAFLAVMTKLMLAQAQECVFERTLLGGFEIELGKCISLAQQAAMVAEKYTLVHTAMTVPPVSETIPNSWINMVDVKSQHYKALAHYYTSVGLLDQVDKAEVEEISDLLSSFYLKSENDENIPSTENVVKRKDDRKRLGMAHLDQAIFLHEKASSLIKMCKSLNKVDTLQNFVNVAHKRSLEKKINLDTSYSEENSDFFEVIDVPDIVPLADVETELRPPILTSVKVTDIFKRLGPLSVFSARQKFTAPRPVKITSGIDGWGFTISGDSPTTAVATNQRAKDLGIKEGDIIFSVEGEDVKWKTCSEVACLLDKYVEVYRKNNDEKLTKFIRDDQGPTINIKVLTLYASENPQTAGKIAADPSGIGDDMFYSSSGITSGSSTTGRNNSNKTFPVKRRLKAGDGSKSLSAARTKNRHSLGFFQGLKLKLKSGSSFATPTENPYASTSSLDTLGRDKTKNNLLTMNFDSISIPKASTTHSHSNRDILSITRSDTFSTPSRPQFTSQSQPQVTMFTKRMDIGLY
ncbi:rhophilin-2-B-like [Styela clava]